MIQIGVLDTFDLFRKSIVSFINDTPGMEVMMHSHCIAEMENSIRLSTIDLLIVDILDFDEGKCARLRKLRHDFPNMKIMVLTDDIRKDQVLNFVNCGVSAYYSKKTTSISFKEAISDVVSGQNGMQVKLGPAVRDSLVDTEILNRPSVNNSEADFSKRELEILDLVCKEKTNAEISEILNLSVRTVESHRRRMIEKTDCKNMIGVVMYAFKRDVPITGYSYSAPVPE